MNLSKRNLFIFGAIILALPIIYFLLWTLPQRQSAAYRAKFTDEEVQKFQAEQKIQYERNVADIEDKTRLTLAQIIGGLALLSGLYFTYQNVKTAQENMKVAQENLRVTEEGKLTERFSNAVELLGSEKLDVRLGGIYALERIARDSQKDHWTVMEVLTAFVRQNSPYVRSKEDLSDKAEIKLREDIQAIMTVIGRRKWSETEPTYIDLQKVDLTGCVLRGANLSKARLSRANLNRVYWKGVDLSKARLDAANLSGAYLNLTLTLSLNQILSAKNFEKAKLAPKLAKEVKEWQAKKAKKKAGAGEDPSEDQTEK